jgi:hypothetical protein
MVLSEFHVLDADSNEYSLVPVLMLMKHSFVRLSLKVRSHLSSSTVVDFDCKVEGFQKILEEDAIFFLGLGDFFWLIK